MPRALVHAESDALFLVAACGVWAPLTRVDASVQHRADKAKSEDAVGQASDPPDLQKRVAHLEAQLACARVRSHAHPAEHALCARPASAPSACTPLAHSG